MICGVGPLTMNSYVALLQHGAEEARAFAKTSPEAKAFSRDWLVRLAERMDAASCLSHDYEVERELEAIAYALIDSGPMNEHFSPSFGAALDALQRAKKHRKTSEKLGYGGYGSGLEK